MKYDLSDLIVQVSTKDEFWWKCPKDYSNVKSNEKCLYCKRDVKYYMTFHELEKLMTSEPI